jgi:DNA adenine methylase
VVYCDPPYLTVGGNFTAYHESGFNLMDHGKLSRKLRQLASAGVAVVASNSDLELVHHLYSGFERIGITAPRSVGAAANSQKAAPELILKMTGMIAGGGIHA